MVIVMVDRVGFRVDEVKFEVSDLDWLELKYVVIVVDNFEESDSLFG